MKPVYGILMAVALVGILCVAGCTTTDTAGTPTPTQTHAPTPEMVSLVSVGEENNRDIVPVSMETVTQVILPENPTTGYSWNVTTVDGLTVTDDTFVPPEKQIPGAGGVHVWTLAPNATGIATFSAVYVRPWEEIQPDDERYTVTFYVTPKGTPVVDVTSADNGTTVSVPNGGAVLVALNENPTTGYLWNASVAGSAKIATDSFVPPHLEKPLVGAGGVHKWLVTFTGAPSGSFDAAYARPWEETTVDAESFTVSFTGV
ncbi:protease inhibitor I42 family protein [Methanogenium cariaci]|jgi:predicted secreted protein